MKKLTIHTTSANVRFEGDTFQILLEIQSGGNTDFLGDGGKNTPKSKGVKDGEWVAFIERDDDTHVWASGLNKKESESALKAKLKKG